MANPYYSVIDFEANCSSKNRKDHEIIEFPAVLIDTDTGKTIDEFHTFVQMITYKRLSEFIKDLTHITDEQVTNGQTWQECLDNFEQWCLRWNLNTDNCTVCTCGDWDLKTMLPNQLEKSKTKLTPYLNELFGCWNNVKVAFDKFVKGQYRGMDGMLKHLGLELTGHYHSGIDDSRNIAKICHKLKDYGCDVSVPNKVRFKNLWYPEHTLTHTRNKKGRVIKN